MQENDPFKILEPVSAKPSFTAKMKVYRPLIVMTVLVFIASIVISVGYYLPWMPIFMGLFLLNFSMFKLFDVDGFAKSFAMYDIIAKRLPVYGKVYPYIELVLALLYLSMVQLHYTNVVTAIIMGIGLIGVLQNHFSGSKTRCACMGNLIDVPVGSVTILENTVMILMAIFEIVIL